MSRLNDGSRPSRLAIGRDLVGECPLPAAHAAHAAATAWRAEVESAHPPPLDISALRARAAAHAPDAPARAPGQVVPLFRRVAPWIGGAMALAAALLLIVKPPPRDGVRVKGDTALGFAVLRDGQSFEGDADTEVRAGDRLRFSYRAGVHDSLVLVGVDGTGTVQTYWPEEGSTPFAIIPGEGQLLDGSIQLDDAPGPEVFVASFSGAEVDAVRAEVGAVYDESGVEGLVALDEARADIAILVLDKP
ncbi:MAG: hypothetical protein EXR71_19290 [Myxococcales bacterium]|nr:hypothetical protein [Myxococcales bacterium]